MSLSCGAHRASYRGHRGNRCPRSGHSQRSFPILSVVRESPIHLPHLRHHWCGTWGSRPSVQVDAQVDMLADCGWTCALLCRHVDISTVAHTGGRLSTSCPPVPPASVPSPYPGARAARARGRRPTSSDGVDPQVRVGSAWVPRGGRRGGRAGPVVTTGERARRDLPNLCTSLGTTRRPVDRGHRCG